MKASILAMGRARLKRLCVCVSDFFVAAQLRATWLKGAQSKTELQVRKDPLDKMAK